MPPYTEPPVLIVGAGVAGLACGVDLMAAGVPVQILEAADAVGGRMRTDRRGGFLLDRGFQVFNTSYPQVKRRLDLRALQLRPFTPGVLLQAGDRRLRFTDPTRQPAGAVDLLAGRLGGPVDVLALARLSAADMLLPARLIKRQPDRTTFAALSEAGVSSELCELFFRPFLAGVFLEDELETSARFFHLVWRTMLRGTLCLPRRGIQAVPEQLAAELPSGTVQLETPAAALTSEGVGLADGRELPARAVIVATGAAEAAQLLGDTVSVPATRTVTTFYHAAAVSPLTEPTLLVDTERTILNTVVLSEVSATFAPEGRALISSSVLGDASDREPDVRARLAELYGTDTAGWEHLASYPVHGALPAMPAPHPLSLPTRLGGGRYVCGDHRATGSVQGAMAS
ncbi:MAG TPA: NAD(P)/FAD-dependent oxidoreductase, partial [Streptosporangiaceae bacterium]|nr:NAD(P)/FAD-dependent oxidoreductase [Streptosporangiaceae bacterium]